MKWSWQPAYCSRSLGRSITEIKADEESLHLITCLLAFFKKLLLDGLVAHSWQSLDGNIAKRQLCTLPRVLVADAVEPVHVEGRPHLGGVESYCSGKLHMDWTASAGYFDDYSWKHWQLILTTDASYFFPRHLPKTTTSDYAHDYQDVLTCWMDAEISY